MFANSCVNKAWFLIAVVTDLLVSDEGERCCEFAALKLVLLQVLFGLDF